MEQVKVFYDRVGNTLTVWFGDPAEEYVCQETAEEVILMKDREGRVIGFEKLNFSVPASEQLRVAFEAVGCSSRPMESVFRGAADGPLWVHAPWSAGADAGGDPP